MLNQPDLYTDKGEYRYRAHDIDHDDDWPTEGFFQCWCRECGAAWASDDLYRPCPGCGIVPTDDTDDA